MEKDGKKIRAIAYVRVSTEEQAQEGISLEVQTQALQAYAKMRDLEMVEVVQDAGVSAGKPLSKRPGGQKVLNTVVSHKVGAVLAFKVFPGRSPHIHRRRG